MFENKLKLWIFFLNNQLFQKKYENNRIFKKKIKITNFGEEAPDKNIGYFDFFF